MFDAAGIGIDLCDIARLEKAIQKQHFYERIYTENERAYLHGRGVVKAQSAAGMFAAKEAVAKALGTGFARGVAPWLIEITHDESGAPGVVLLGGAQEKLEEIGGSHVLLSISHEGNTAAAFAVIQRKA